jgi:hypothetical protein
VPSAEQINNRRKGRAEDRIPQTAQDRIGLLTFTVRNKALDSLACKTGGNHHLRTGGSRSSPRSGRIVARSSCVTPSPQKACRRGVGLWPSCLYPSELLRRDGSAVDPLDVHRPRASALHFGHFRSLRSCLGAIHSGTQRSGCKNAGGPRNNFLTKRAASLIFQLLGQRNPRSSAH